MGLGTTATFQNVTEGLDALTRALRE
jgi:hypothetical protein